MYNVNINVTVGYELSFVSLNFKYDILVYFQLLLQSCLLQYHAIPHHVIMEIYYIFRKMASPELKKAMRVLGFKISKEQARKIVRDMGSKHHG